MLEEILADIAPDWELDAGGIYGDSSNLVCPHGNVIEQDGTCPEGCVSPLMELGFI